MKKHLLWLMAGLFSFVACTAFAQQGGYTGPIVDAITVADAKTLPDEAPVILKGRIKRALGDEKYIFEDRTGGITIEIRQKLWGKMKIDEFDGVEISGEVDRGFGKIEIKVKTLKRQ